MKNFFTTKKIAFLALFTALIMVTTLFVQIPNPVAGYTNLGDTFIFIGSALFGPFFALISGAIGSALADVLLGFASYAPFTFVVKGLEGFLSGILIKAFMKIKLNKHVAVIFSFIIAAIEMVFGYFLTNTVLYDVSAGVSSIVSDCFQGGLSVIIAYILTFALSKIKYLNKYTDNALKENDENENSID